ncbi:pheromone receptor PREA [Microsporum canis CBS 113480]|uniref:Pheromone receptor PREA n=1 Tax=Arthroderma otae (strain ATCC MYA-4605 / CBS 113480) TaxID=554155 RepID=C5FJB1_ARTOC|nr:pheromone receptor PREA [Microsporum canis CBS 113480]EEQ29532.1 pheromone receptor PREA [Microsporum canis CBS 113480]
MSFLVCIPPLIWHCRNGNFPASCLIMWILTQNLFNFINPLIWPDDDVNSWWMGYGYCDIQSKLITGAGVGIAGPLVCIFRSLAKVLDTERTTLVPSKGDRRWNTAFEAIYCVVIPVIIMALHFIIQDSRYYIYSIVGCMPAYHSSWVSFIVGYIWPPIILVVACFYCGNASLPSNVSSGALNTANCDQALVLYRLFKYKRDFSQLVSSSSTTTKSNFIRLLTISLVLLLGSLPAQFFVFYSNITSYKPWAPYSWDEVHGPQWTAAGFLLFIFFGIGHDATMMYRSILLRLGFGDCFPALRHPHLMINQRQGSSSTRFGSFSSTVKMALGRKKVLTSTVNSDITLNEKTRTMSLDGYLFNDLDLTSSLDKQQSVQKPYQMPAVPAPVNRSGNFSKSKKSRWQSGDSIFLEFLTDTPGTSAVNGRCPADGHDMV